MAHGIPSMTSVANPGDVAKAGAKSGGSVAAGAASGEARYTRKPAGAKIVARGLTKRFQSTKGLAVDALGPIDMHIGVGEFLAVVGPSGCGKSTLLNVAA